MAVVAELGPEFPARRLLCLHNTKTRSRCAADFDYLVQLAVWSAKKDVTTGDTKCRACSHFFKVDTGCEVEGLCNHCLARCTCADDREYTEETCYCTDNISQHDAFLRGFGGPGARVKFTVKRRAETELESSPTKPRSA